LSSPRSQKPRGLAGGAGASSVTPSRGEVGGGGDAAADASSAGAAMDERETRPLERQAGSMGAAGAEEFPPCVLWPWRAGLFFGLVSSVTSSLSFFLKHQQQQGVR